VKCRDKFFLDFEQEENNEYKPFTAKRWTEVPIPIVKGNFVEYSDEQKKQFKKDLETLMRKSGVLKPDESLE
jgi:hypothetical protein